ncbi:MAG TPA: sensor histidine kinase [Burkholderiaceae bacterium]
MRLGEFILSSEEQILSEWEQYAATLLPAASAMSVVRLRDHASQLLRVIAKDLEQAQSPFEQSQKSKGHAPADASLPDTAAELHAMLRAQEGFDINQMAGEYRALRASVLRLWAAQADFQSTDFQDMLRFNEAIDQALAESIASFSTEVERSRNLLLGMLGHDMRNPLMAILLTAKHVVRMNTGSDLSAAGERLLRSGARMRALLDELVDFSRTRLGVGIRIKRDRVDLHSVFMEELDLIRAAYPEARVELSADGDTVGHWDRNRIHQVLGNLVSNAVKYGRAEPVVVNLTGTPESVTFSVENTGEPIPTEHLATLFDPLTRAGQTDDDGLGLGLYIVEQIVVAHGGAIQVISEGTTTRFTVTLPRAESNAES